MSALYYCLEQLLVIVNGFVDQNASYANRAEKNLFLPTFAVWRQSCNSFSLSLPLPAPPVYLSASPSIANAAILPPQALPDTTLPRAAGRPSRPLHDSENRAPA